VSRRSRILGFGSAALLVVAGGVCAAVFSAGLGEVLALVLISVGVVEATSLVFLEVGFSEDRERARESESRESESRESESRERDRSAERPSAGPPKHSSEPARPGRIRLPRTRGRPRRLR
jgi:hypothetical protein